MEPSPFIYIKMYIGYHYIIKVFFFSLEMSLLFSKTSHFDFSISQSWRSKVSQSWKRNIHIFSFAQISDNRLCQSQHENPQNTIHKIAKQIYLTKNLQSFKILDLFFIINIRSLVIFNFIRKVNQHKQHKDSLCISDQIHLLPSFIIVYILWAVCE